VRVKRFEEEVDVKKYLVSIVPENFDETIVEQGLRIFIGGFRFLEGTVGDQRRVRRTVESNLNTGSEMVENSLVRMTHLDER
jgi:hypothetical protein